MLLNRNGSDCLVAEFTTKIEKVRKLLHKIEKDALLLTSQASFSWLTSGRGYIGIASEGSCGKVLITLDDVVVISNNIEQNRLREEELAKLPLKVLSFNWYETDGERNLLNGILENRSLVEEKEVLTELAEVRYPLSEEEMIRYEQLGKDVGTIIEKVSQELKKGETEFEIAARMAQLSMELGIEPVTNLIAADHRVFNYRHPIPTMNKLESYALLAIGGRRGGLVASATRLVHFGKPSSELIDKHRAVCEVDSTFIANTRPGIEAREVFKRAVACYEKTGYSNEWTLHHQGGLTGYLPREYRANLESTERIGHNQAFSWNPSITGVKSEDTILVKENDFKIITRTGNFPEIEIEVDGEKIYRPALLVRN